MTGSLKIRELLAPAAIGIKQLVAEHEAMVQLITASDKFIDWIGENNISWNHPLESRDYTDHEMVIMYLRALKKI